MLANWIYVTLPLVCGIVNRRYVLFNFSLYFFLQVLGKSSSPIFVLVVLKYKLIVKSLSFVVVMYSGCVWFSLLHSLEHQSTDCTIILCCFVTMYIASKWGFNNPDFHFKICVFTCFFILLFLVIFSECKSFFACLNTILCCTYIHSDYLSHLFLFL